MAENTKIRPTRSERQSRKGNPNWKGGRSVASNGYVLIRVGVGHHLADVRGYAYEHRLVAEAKYGRRLVEDEHVHHINENKTDNRPENLEILGAAEHRKRHRNADSDYVYDLISIAPIDRADIALYMGKPAREVGWILNRMLKRGQAYRTGYGSWYAYDCSSNPKART